MTTNATTEKTNRAAQLLADTITALKNSEDFKRALEFRSQFHSYSFANCFLIYQQCPQATYIAGYRKWQELGRQVKKGEKSIAIFAPLIRKEKSEGSSKKIPMVFGFRSVSVFDVTQTEGEDVPELPRPKLLEGDSLGFDSSSAVPNSTPNLKALGLPFRSWKKALVTTASKTNASF